MAGLFLQVLNMGITAGYCVLVILALRLLLRKLPKIYSYVLWAVVYFRLVCPVSFHSAFSLVRVNPQTIPREWIAQGSAGQGGTAAQVAAGAAISQPDGMLTGSGGAVWQPDGAVSRLAGVISRICGTAAAATPGTGAAASQPDGMASRMSEAMTHLSGAAPQTSDVLAQNSSVAGGTAVQMIPQAAETGMSPVRMALAAAGWIWIAVAAALILYHLWSVYRLRRQLRDAARDDGEVYEAENLSTPFVFGIVAPRIYLPAALDGRERRYVLAHERTHIRRKDYLIKQAAYLVTCIYWFHPLVWLAFYLMCRDMEMSCDECVIREMGGSGKKEYTASLLSLASGRQILAGTPLAFGEGGIRARITNVLNYHRPVLRVRVLFAALLAFVMSGLAVNPAVKADYQYGNMPAELSDIRIASGEEWIRTADGESLHIELWMTEGVYYDEAHGTPGVGTYAENYEGSYELRTVNAQEETVFSENLAGLWGDGSRERFNFPGEFELTCADYNGDGCPDFTIGQAGSSAVNLFMLFTVRPDGSVARLCETEILSQETDACSVVFRHEPESEGKPFVTYIWSNVTAETEILRYRWNEAKGMYEEDSEGFGNAKKAEEAGLMSGEPAPAEDELVSGKQQAVGPASAEDELVSGKQQAGSEMPDGAVSDAWGSTGHRSGFVEPVLHLYVPEGTLATGYVNLALPQEEASAYAVRALRELYDLTGTQITECYYFYYDIGGFVFAQTKEDMDHGREFYGRWYGEEENEAFIGIASMDISYARRLWYSPVYQYDLPEAFAGYDDGSRAVWFTVNSALYNGQKVARCFQPYDAMPEVWRVIMEDDTAYELTLDTEIDSVSNITGPYPDSNINH